MSKNPDSKSPFFKILILFLVWRITTFTIAAISPIIIPNFGARFPYYHERLIATGLPHFIWSFGNFDGVHYLGIAKDAYSYQFTQAFFPVYPIIIKLISNLTFGSLLISALLISNLAFLAALLVFYKLVRQFFDEKIALWSCLFVLSFPTSFFFGSVYTEGPFFLLVVSSFYLLSKNRMLAASILGAIASGTRFIGLFLAPAFLISGRKNLISILIIPIGFLIYVAYLKIKFNNPLYFLTSQQIFGQGRSTESVILLPQVFWRYIKILLTAQGSTQLVAVFELTATIFALIILILSYKKMKTEWLIFSALAVIIPTLTGTLTSMPRYILIAFPIYIYLASIEKTRIKILILSIFSALLVIATSLFTQGYWIA